MQAFNIKESVGERFSVHILAALNIETTWTIVCISLAKNSLWWSISGTNDSAKRWQRCSDDEL